MFRKIIRLVSIIFCLNPLFAVEAQQNELKIPEEIIFFEKCYPDLRVQKDYDKNLNDWKLTISCPSRKDSKRYKSNVFYWANGRILPKEELANKEKYWSLFYKYENNLRDPKTFTKKEINQMEKMGSAKTRQNAAGTPMFFFDFIYSATSETDIESHIMLTKFLGKSTRVHERIIDAIKAVENKIYENQDDEEISAFLKNLKSADAFYWRQIANTSRKSFHSYGIAMDVLPVKYGGKEVYWSWAKDKFGSDKWMLTPLEKRWMPPKKVIQIFEDEGFIWGGYWAIWDNMHFEYHPELTKKR